MRGCMGDMTVLEHGGCVVALGSALGRWHWGGGIRGQDPGAVWVGGPGHVGAPGRVRAWGAVLGMWWCWSCDGPGCAVALGSVALGSVALGSALGRWHRGGGTRGQDPGAV